MGTLCIKANDNYDYVENKKQTKENLLTFCDRTNQETEHSLSSKVLIESENLDKTMTLDDLTILFKLDEGAFGQIYLVKMKQQLFAMKVISKWDIQDNKVKEGVLCEINILKKLKKMKKKSPFLVQVYSIIQNPAHVFMVMEFMQGGNLYTYLKAGRLKETQAKYILAEVLLGLIALHQQNIIYRDLKPQNIMVDAQGHIKIIDFNLSKQIIDCKYNIYIYIYIEDSYNYSMCGTKEYLAPEIAKGHGYQLSSDYFNLGCLLFHMLEGEPPFSHNPALDYSYTFHRKYKANTIAILNGLLQEIPSQRLGNKSYLQILQHPFFQDVDFHMVNNKQYKLGLGVKLKGSLDLRYFQKARQVSKNSCFQCLDSSDNNNQYDIFTPEEQIQWSSFH